MPRKRNGRISESARTLTTLERRHAANPQQALRIRMLRMLRENESLTLSQVSQLLGCSERTVNRWMKEYNSHGLDALLGSDDGRTRIKNDELEALRSLLKAGDVGTLNEIQCWLRDRFGVEYSLKAISNLLQHRLKARRVWVIP